MYGSRVDVGLGVWVAFRGEIWKKATGRKPERLDDWMIGCYRVVVAAWSGQPLFITHASQEPVEATKRKRSTCSLSHALGTVGSPP